MDQVSQDTRTIGVVGLGLMGSSITTAFVISGYKVIAVAPIQEDLEGAPHHLLEQLDHADTLDLLNQPLEYFTNRITLTEDYNSLKECSMVMECVIEDRNIKSSVYQKIENVVSPYAIIGTNTSAIPISALQQYLREPGRFMGIHWAEPAYSTRFLEIICGAQTNLLIAKRVCKWAENWNKEPTLLQKDIRGFITNRLMYAVYREALSLEQAGVATLKDMDKAARYDMGSWITVMGIFRRMDYMGLQDEVRQVVELLPRLSDSKERPPIMEAIVKHKDRGIHSGQGMYSYSQKEAELWKQAFGLFNRDMFFLTNKYVPLKTPKIEGTKS